MELKAKGNNAESECTTALYIEESLSDSSPDTEGMMSSEEGPVMSDGVSEGCRECALGALALPVACAVASWLR